MIYREADHSRLRRAGWIATALLGAAAVATLAGRHDRGGRAAAPVVAAAPPVAPEWPVDSVIAPVVRERERGAFPGAAIAYGGRGRSTVLVGVGAIGWRAGAPGVDPRTTMYDLASVTKLVATDAAVMLLIDEGRLRLDQPVGDFLPAFRGRGKEGITFRHLLTHTSGLPAGTSLRGRTPEAVTRHLLDAPAYYPPGRHVEYSDLNYVALWEAARVAAGEPLPRYLERRLFRPAGMAHTRFLPGLDCEACAPTGRLRDQRLYRGKPFDPTAQKLGGVSGSAGLFSSAADLARFAELIVNGGVLDGRRYFGEATLREFMSPQPVAGRRTLGFEVFCREGPRPDREPCDELYALGHTGYTGTSLWIDPARGVWAVLLTNRTYEPRATSRIDLVRRAVFERVETGRAGPASLALDEEAPPARAGTPGAAAGEAPRATGRAAGGRPTPPRSSR